MQPHTPHTPLLIPAALLGTALLLISCSKTVIDNPESPASQLPKGAITFADVATRALIDSKDEISAFSVWGYYVPDNAATTGEDATPIFTGDKVTKSGSTWSYEGLRYWQEGNSYRFFAVYPFDTENFKLETGDGATGYHPYITISDFDVAQNQIDLMTAQTGYMDYPEGGEAPGKVAFTFGHTLSAIKFNVAVDRSEGSDFRIKIISASLFGIPKKGDFSTEDEKEHWTYTGTDLSTQSSPFKKMSGNGDTIVDSETFSLFGDDDCLVIPAADLSSMGAVLELEYQTSEESETGWSESKYRTVDLSSLSNEWMAGVKYLYTITIGEYLTFSVNVVPWNTSTGGIITVE